MNTKEFNRGLFQALLRKGIGSQTQIEFALQVQMAPPTISRMLNDPDIPRPKISTLEALAANMKNVTYSELMHACGYEIPEFENVVASVEEKISDFVKINKNEFHFFSNVEEVKSSMKSYLENERGHVEIADRSYTDQDYKKEFKQIIPESADDSKVILVQWEYDEYVCQTEFSLYYVITQSNNILLIGTDVEEKLHESKIFKNYIRNTLVKPKDYYEKEKRLLQTIQNTEILPTTYAGYGFYLHGKPNGFEKFLNYYGDIFCDTKKNVKMFQKVIMQGEDAEVVFKEYTDMNGYSGGIGAVIADIMAKKTGMDYTYYPVDISIPEKSQNECIMVTAKYNLIDRMDEDQKNFLYSCAKLLELEKFGVVYYNTSVLKETYQVYETKTFTYRN